MNDPTKIVPCPTCSLTINGDGSVSHEPNCLAQKAAKHESALHRIGHILKEVGITAVELPVEIIAKNTFMGGDE